MKLKTQLKKLKSCEIKNFKNLNCRYRIFIVNDQTWEEHNKVGIAAINDPLVTHPNNRNANAARQSAIAEISGIRPGDILFFNRMKSPEHPPEIIGLFVATSSPYYDNSPLYPGAKYVNETLPFRVEFKQLCNFPYPINVDEVWELKEKGKIWTLQQTRGDAVGVHACIGISKFEALEIVRLLKANNILLLPPKDYNTERKKVGLDKINKQSLPLDFRVDKKGCLHYEHVLQALLLEDFADGKHKEVFGDYDDFIPNVPTGSRKEIDILLVKYNENNILWYQILELKHDKFTMEELQRLIAYEKWLIKTRAELPLQVHPIAIAFEFDKEVINFVRGRKAYLERPIRLIKYTFNEVTRSIKLEEVYGL